MKIAAIVCEYNPFHNGHKYQIDTARKLLGEDTLIVAVMSGNFTQRGEPAVCDKLIRAKAAVLSGVNLVLELPFPYSMSSAEFFAKSSVHIISKLGCVDYLVFGCECESADRLFEYARRTNSQEFKQKLKELTDGEELSGLGYPKLFELAYNELFPSEENYEISSPNNILAIEYIRALWAENSSITPIAIKREGAGYNDVLSYDKEYQSASAIRKMIEENSTSALDFVPNLAKETFSEAIKDKEMPANIEALSGAVISHFRLNPPTENCNIHDAAGGLYNRLYNNSFEAKSISSLTLMTETKKYTRARIRRAIWNSFFGVTSSDLRTPPAFTQILALDRFGRSILKRIPKMTDFHIFTKPADTDGLSDEILRQKEASRRADSIYGLCFEKNISGNSPLKMTPFVKK